MMAFSKQGESLLASVAIYLSLIQYALMEYLLKTSLNIVLEPPSLLLHNY